MPVVRFEAETQAGWEVAAICETVWQSEGAALAVSLLPDPAATDTVAASMSAQHRIRENAFMSLP